MKGALSLLQRPLLEPFHQRIWTNLLEPPIDPKHPDKQVSPHTEFPEVSGRAHLVPAAPWCSQEPVDPRFCLLCLQRMCRRLLALYDLPSWGRCELVLSLLQEPDVTYSLEDVVQAVKESHDKDFIRRLLNNECPCCLCIFPRSKVAKTAPFSRRDVSLTFSAEKLLSFTRPHVSDAVADFLSVLRVPRVLQAALHHCCERQTHQRHGVSCVQRAGHQRPGTAGQLLLHAGYSGTQTERLLVTRCIHIKQQEPSVTPPSSR